MQRYTIFFITVSAVQELKNCTHNIWYVPGLLAATASGSSNQAWHIPLETCRALTVIKNTV